MFASTGCSQRSSRCRNVILRLIRDEPWLGTQVVAHIDMCVTLNGLKTQGLNRELSGWLQELFSLSRLETFWFHLFFFFFFLLFIFHRYTANDIQLIVVKMFILFNFFS